MEVPLPTARMFADALTASFKKQVQENCIVDVAPAQIMQVAQELEDLRQDFRMLSEIFEGTINVEANERSEVYTKTGELVTQASIKTAHLLEAADKEFMYG